jgi:Kef-type K+ transport system membrane component KefB
VTSALAGLLGVSLISGLALGATDDGGGRHVDPFAPIILLLVAILVAAVLGRWLASRLDQPAVLGELLIGLVLGNVAYALDVGPAVLIMHLDQASGILRTAWEGDLSINEAAARVLTEAQLAPGQIGARLLDVMTGPDNDNIMIGVAFFLFSNLGLLLLMFIVGLESSVEEMRRAGGPAIRVAIVGVAAPFLLGCGAGVLLLPEAGLAVHLFLGATLTATSVGITAGVLQDIGRLHTAEARVILGAAVVDDVLGLIVLAVVIGVVTTGELQIAEAIKIALMSFAFLAVLFVFGKRIVGFGLPLFDVLDRHDCKLLYPLFLCFTIAYLADLFGLAAIVGAFAAGVILSDEQFKGHEGERSMEELIEPLEAMFAPVFFVLMGMQVNLASFLDLKALLVALALILAAIAGKSIAGLCAGRGVNRVAVGIGMVPRGEVGLIFAGTGRGLGVIDDSLFSAIVITVVVTTMIAPSTLKWSLAR